MSHRKSAEGKEAKIPQLTFKGPATSPSPRKPPASGRTAKSQRVLGQIKELNAKRPVLLKPISDEQKIQFVCDWLSSTPPCKFGSWLYRFNVLLQGLPGLQIVAPEMRSLAGVALTRGSAIMTVEKLPNESPHWGTFCAAPELAENPSYARVMIMESARVKPDTDQSGEDLESLWVVVANTKLDLVLVDPLDRTATLVDDHENIKQSADMKLLKAGMQLEFVETLKHEMQRYCLQRYPCPNSAVNVVVRQGDIRFPQGTRNCVKIDLGLGTEHDAFQWSSRWMSEWRILIDTDKPNRAEITGEITSDSYSLSFGAFRLKQRRRVPTFYSDINIFEVDRLVKCLLSVIEKTENETQTAIQRWLCDWHETHWRLICRDNTYAANEYAPLVLQRQEFAAELMSAIKANVGD